jgi:trigger factor
MKATWEKTDKNTGVLTVEVNEENFAEALDKAFKKVVKKVNVPGFRKGKVPRAIFEKRFGVEALYQDAIDILLPDAYKQAVEQTGIHPVDRPEIDVEQIEKGKSFIFKATVTVKPEVELGEYKGIVIEPKEFKVTDEDVEKELKNRQERVASLEVVDDEEASLQDGDHALIDFEGFVDNEPFEGGQAENYNLVIGSGTFIPGFEEQMIGMKKGETKDIEVTFPEKYHNEELAGKPALFKVTVKEIKRKNLPPLDDEFAKDVSEFETLEEFKQDLRNKLEERAKEEENQYKRDYVIEKAAEAAIIDIPEVMIKNEAHKMVHEFEERLLMQGLNLATYFNFTGQDEESLMEQFKENAEKRVRINLTLDAIATKENIEVSEEEVDAEFERLAEQYKRSKEEVKTLFEARGLLDSVKEDLRIRKTVDFLVEHTKSA